MTMDNDARDGLRQHYEAVLSRLEKGLGIAGRKREEVLLLAVSKFQPADAVAALAAMGQMDFGENYVQEALEKRHELDNADLTLASKLRWHMIGHVQSRKASQTAGNFCLIHTLDSVKLASAMEKHLCQLDAVQKVLIEVNVGDEDQKTGLAREDLHALADHVQSSCPHLSLQGLMCIPPVYDAGEEARPYFALLRKLCEELRLHTGLALPELSMGMSGDFEWAIAEGATIVRVGTDIFGPRPHK